MLKLIWGPNATRKAHQNFEKKKWRNALIDDYIYICIVSFHKRQIDIHVACVPLFNRGTTVLNWVCGT